MSISQSGKESFFLQHLIHFAEDPHFVCFNCNGEKKSTCPKCEKKHAHYIAAYDTHDSIPFIGLRTYETVTAIFRWRRLTNTHKLRSLRWWDSEQLPHAGAPLHAHHATDRRAKDPPTDRRPPTEMTSTTLYVQTMGLCTAADPGGLGEAFPIGICTIWYDKMWVSKSTEASLD